MNAITNTLPAAIGAPMEGGFFVGLIMIKGTVYGLAVAPKATGEFELPWSENNKFVAGATDFVDGLENTVAMGDAGSKLAQTIRELRIDDFEDWYLPSQAELDIAYRALKPTTDANSCYNRSGLNAASLPPAQPYSMGGPVQTSAQAFQAGGAEAFDAVDYWTSTQHAAFSDGAWSQYFDDGYQDYSGKSAAGRARAFRRFAI
ncbi:MAG: DUF1566 domain-containing protein [Pseudomonadota bacterium]